MFVTFYTIISLWGLCKKGVCDKFSSPEREICRTLYFYKLACNLICRPI